MVPRHPLERGELSPGGEPANEPRHGLGALYALGPVAVAVWLLGGWSAARQSGGQTH